MPAGEMPRLPDSTCAATGVPEGSLLPRLVLIEFPRPGDTCLFLHEGRFVDGSSYRVSALYVLDPSCPRPPAACPSASPWRTCSMLF